MSISEIFEKITMCEIRWPIHDIQSVFWNLCYVVYNEGHGRFIIIWLQESALRTLYPKHDIQLIVTDCIHQSCELNFCFSGRKVLISYNFAITIRFNLFLSSSLLLFHFKSFYLLFVFCFSFTVQVKHFHLCLYPVEKTTGVLSRKTILFVRCSTVIGLWASFSFLFIIYVRYEIIIRIMLLSNKIKNTFAENSKHHDVSFPHPGTTISFLRAKGKEEIFHVWKENVQRKVISLALVFHKWYAFQKLG